MPCGEWLNVDARFCFFERRRCIRRRCVSWRRSVRTGTNSPKTPSSPCRTCRRRGGQRAHTYTLHLLLKGYCKYCKEEPNTGNKVDGCSPFSLYFSLYLTFTMYFFNQIHFLPFDSFLIKSSVVIFIFAHSFQSIPLSLTLLNSHLTAPSQYG